MGFTTIGGKQMSKGGAAGEAQTPEDMIKNVERMLANEKTSAKQTAKGGAKLVSFDLNDGMVGASGAGAEGELDQDIQ